MLASQGEEKKKRDESGFILQCPFLIARTGADGETERDEGTKTIVRNKRDFIFQRVREHRD